MVAAQSIEVLVTARNPSDVQDLRARLAEKAIRLGGDAVALPCFNSSDLRSATQFSAAAFMQQSTAPQLGSVLLSAASLPSTQTLLQDNAQLFSCGTVCVADTQNSGKGRAGNVWTSPPGCLMFSVMTRLQIQGTRLPFIQYVASLAICQAIEAQTAPLLGGEGLRARIKWPNDLYAGPHKLGGILCHTVYREQQFQIVIGIGLNLSNEQPSTCINALIRQQLEQEPSAILPNSREGVSPEALLANILAVLEQHLETLRTEGFVPLEQAYLDSWLHTGQQVTLQARDGEPAAQVMIEGLTADGYLRASDASGQQFSLSPDGNSLDFFQGLIKKKLPST